MPKFISQISTTESAEYPSPPSGLEPKGLGRSEIDPQTVEGRFTLPPFPGALERKGGLPRRVGVISDLHIPFHSPRRVDACLSFIEASPPDLLVILGDIWDCYPISRWDKSADRHKRIKDEIEIGQPIIDRINRLPCSIVFLMGNHDERFDLLLKKLPELEGAVDFRSVFRIPERWEVFPPRTLYQIGGLTYLHGDLPGYRGGVGCERRMIQELRASCIFGHTHATGTHFMRGSANALHGGYAVGHLASPEVSREYRPTNNWVSSFASVHNYSSDLFSVQLHLLGESGIIV